MVLLSRREEDGRVKKGRGREGEKEREMDEGRDVWGREGELCVCVCVCVSVCVCECV